MTLVETTAADDTRGSEDGVDEPMLQSCALSDIKPDAMDPVEVGTDEQQLPPGIGTLLTRNCGCHFAEPPFETERRLAGYGGPLDMTQWSGFHEEHAFPLCQSRLAHACAHERLLHASFPMPPTSCELEGGERITEEDLQELEAWLAAGAPDGATWE